MSKEEQLQSGSIIDSIRSKFPGKRAGLSRRLRGILSDIGKSTEEEAAIDALREEGLDSNDDNRDLEETPK
jgi:hypothetical protein